VVELTVEKASGQAAFVDPNSAAGPQPRSILVLVLDGYSGGWGCGKGHALMFFLWLAACAAIRCAFL
jgi:hypothetical protein